MTDFDPYYVWLGIPPDEQPANYYRLLGLRAFEANADVIDHAADRQMAHLRSFSAGERAGLAQRLLNEVSAARVCLLDAKAKADYDARLRAAMMPPQSTPPPFVVPPSTAQPQAIPVRAAAAPLTSPTPLVVGNAPRRRAKRSPVVAAIVVVGAVALAGLLVANAMNSRDGDGDRAVDEASSIAANERKSAERKATDLNVKTRKAERDDREATSAAANRNEFAEAALDAPLDAPIDDAGKMPPVDKPGADAPSTEGESSEEPPPVDPDGPSDGDAPFESLLEEPAASPGATQSDSPKPAVGRLPLPDAVAVAAKSEEIRSLFRKQFAQTQPREVTAFGRELLALARDTKDDSLGRYVTLKLAIERAAMAGDSETAQAAAEVIAAQYDADRLDTVADALLATANGGVPTLERAALAERLFAAAREAYAIDRLDLASTLVPAMVDAARNARLSSAAKRAVALAEKIATAKEQWPEAKAAMARLVEHPDDAAACLVAGRYHCLAKNDWERGLPYLARGGDEALKKLAAIELSPSPTPEQFVAAADGWWAVADSLEPAKQKAIRMRALAWYVRANDALAGGLDKLRIAKRLAEAAVVEALPEDAALVLTFEEDTFATRGGLAVATDKSGKRANVAFHGAKAAEGRAGKALTFETAAQFGDAGNPPLLKAPAELTVCAWIKPAPGGDGPGDIASKDDWQGRARGFVLRTFRNSHIDFTVGNWDWNSVVSPAPPRIGMWQHVAGSYDAKEIRLYLDGKLVARKKLARPVVPSPWPLSIGRGTFAKDRGFSGAIDELAIFTRALDEGEIAEVFRAGAAGMRLAK